MKVGMDAITVESNPVKQNRVVEGANSLVQPVHPLHKRVIAAITLTAKVRDLIAKVCALS